MTIPTRDVDGNDRHVGIRANGGPVYDSAGAMWVAAVGVRARPSDGTVTRFRDPGMLPILHRFPYGRSFGARARGIESTRAAAAPLEVDGR